MTDGVTDRQARRPPSAHPRQSSSHVVERIDRAFARVLRVQPQPHECQAVAGADGWPYEGSLLVAALRCTMRYLVLPFVLPLLAVATGPTLGIVAGAAVGLLLTLDVIAAIAIVNTLRQLWRVQHPCRWQYLPVALALGVLIGVFFVNDARVLFR